ncbi:hypothetical protein AMAG_07596 [Allomyces macrogynus ATCC 38327]|uniref:AD domain-containing protein n=1 Tax=Allomyces macrogynus (strain ATCC 38327) TaxID=578462 RepID=A0A0L0SIR9_ALLM3|nr:hypothetical protein AMAG_07596 [Allomyces macrogynus ATCC 38327]|eukprot:KNE62372.1 hypothetical protein AMAG_07596 [Allomyces macrogynus ATCC 38327]
MQSDAAPKGSAAKPPGAKPRSSSATGRKPRSKSPQPAPSTSARPATAAATTNGSISPAVTEGKGAADAASGANTIHRAVGHWVRIELGLAPTAPDGAAAAVATPFVGQIYAYDPVNELVVLQCVNRDHPASALTKKLDLRFIHTRSIRQVTVLSSPPAEAKGLPALDASVAAPLEQTLLPVTAIHWEQTVQREAAAVRVMQGKVAKLGVGVGRDGQEIFDALSKTMECRWHETAIVVMDSVLIAAPYTPAACQGNDERALMRVRKVLEGERRKLGLAPQ